MDPAAFAQRDFSRLVQADATSRLRVRQPRDPWNRASGVP